MGLTTESYDTPMGCVEHLFQELHTMMFSGKNDVLGFLIGKQH